LLESAVRRDGSEPNVNNFFSRFLDFGSVRCSSEHHNNLLLQIWQECLAEADLKENHRKSHRYTIIGYLAYLKERGELANLENARAFVESKMRRERPEEWSRKRLRLTRFCRQV